MCAETTLDSSVLAGGWTNPFEKSAGQFGSFPQGLGWKLKNETTT